MWQDENDNLVNIINYKAYLFSKIYGVEPNMILIDYKRYRELSRKYPNVIFERDRVDKKDRLTICNIPATIVSGDVLEVGYFSALSEVEVY